MGMPDMARYLEVPIIGPQLHSSSNSNNSNTSRTSPSTSSDRFSSCPISKSTCTFATLVGMSSNNNKQVLSLHEVNLEAEFDIVKTLSEGCFSKVLLVRPHHQRERLVLKAIHCEATSAEEFSRETFYNYYLSPHPNILSSYNVSFIWDNAFVYAQEYAAFGDLSRFVRKDGLPEDKVKSIAAQLVSAVEFIHSFHLVHRDIRVENVLVFRKDLSLVKLGDFGHTLPSGSSIVKTKTEFMACTVYGPYCPPEVAEIVLQERYYCHGAEDVWSLAILLINLLTGEVPWTAADAITDPAYSGWVDWLKRKSLKMPELFANFTPRFLRLLKRVLEPKAGKRSKVSEITKYTTDEWLSAKGVASVGGRRTSVERHESNATSKSGHNYRLQHTGSGMRPYGLGGKKRSTRSLKLDNELETEEESFNERVGRWVYQSTINNNITTTPASSS